MASEDPVFHRDEPTLAITQVSEITGLSADTLRYYEKAGLIHHVGRTTGNLLRYASSDLAWLEFLGRLRDTGMSIDRGTD